ncbi:uncharacterized protein KY384_005468 [Bacidia gigantensis]|uniref:uncharacterized protein n=1 Tax=Bacidia gigantensis TaxID=2732470 RepID=UPI001D04E033|nr:uncharacterized protein KY384_005468 [Bacidia gigantensis]KAG8529986.1 hypothetical protein KY384_005468 [Bacidia gigantensis]
MPPPRDHTLPNPVEGPGDFTTTSTVHNDTYPAISSLNSDLSSKTVLVAGASKGIGASIALSFARAGASQIAIGSRSPQEQLVKGMKAAATDAKRPEPAVLALSLDVTDQASVETAAKEVEKAFGKMDIVVFNAGYFAAGKIGEIDPGMWWRNWEVNIKGLFLVTRSFLPLMLKGEDKTIVTVSSVGAHLRGPAMSGYQTSKIAQLRLMEFVCAEYADQGILAYSIHPGNVAGTDIMGGGELPEYLKHIFVESAELSADTITFLTREKRHWLAGRYVNCTWDMPELMKMEREIVKDDKLKLKLAL